MQTQMMQKSWLSALALAIKSFCSLFVETTEVLNDGVSMASKSVRAARRRQVVDLSISERNYEQEAEDLAALQRLKTRAEIDDFCKESPERRKAFDEERLAISNAVKAELAKLDAEEASRRG